MRATIWYRLAAAGLAVAFCGGSVSAGVMTGAAAISTVDTDVIQVAQKKKPRGGGRASQQQQAIQSAKKYLPPEYHQYLPGGAGGAAGGAGGMGGMGR